MSKADSIRKILGEIGEYLAVPRIGNRAAPPAKTGGLSGLRSDPNFALWFGDSKAVDEYGEPLRVFHGTLAPGAIEEFRPGSHFGTAQQANIRIDNLLNFGPRSGASTPHITPAYLSVRNPMRAQDVLEDGWDSVIERAKRAGHDSIVYLNRGEVTPEQSSLINALERKFGALSDKELAAKVPGIADSYIVFDPGQIKSAISNTGAFDPRQKSVRKAKGGLAVKRRPK